MEARIDLTKEYGLVLEGGGAKGAYRRLESLKRGRSKD